MQKVTIGLYRHFKGAYYYVTNISRQSSEVIDTDCIVTYFNVCHPEYGYFSRPLVDFVSDNDTLEKDDKGEWFGVGTAIADRKDNVTGQIHRMERVKDLDFQLGSVSTEQLIRELRTRKDSPIHELDLDGLYSEVFAKDYVIGVKHEATDETPRGVETFEVFDSEEEAKRYAERKGNVRSSVFKRTFIEV